MSVKIKSLRTAADKTQQELADVLGLSVTQIGKYERGWEPLPLVVARDLAVFFDTDIHKVTGRQVEPTEWKGCEHAIIDAAEPYGGLFVTVAGTEFEYPISMAERQRILQAMSGMDVSNDRERPDRLFVEAMSNRLVLINMAHVRKLYLSSDDERMTPHFAHPEVYVAVEQNMERATTFGPVLTKALQEHYEAVGGEEAAEAEVQQMTCVYADGTREPELYVNDEWVGVSLFGLELCHDSASPGTFVRLESEGYYEEGFFNLDHIAILEIPHEEYRRTTAPEE